MSSGWTAFWSGFADMFQVFALSAPPRLWVVVLYGVLALALTPVSYLLLSQTLRRTRVRPAQLVRVGAYSLMMLPALTAAWYFTIIVGDFVMQATYSAALWGGAQLAEIAEAAMIAAGVCSILLPPGWAMLWWHAAARHYLRLPHALAVAVILGFTAGLASFVTVFVSLVAWQSARGTAF